MHSKIPFSVYGDNLIILMQNFVIVLLLWTFNKQISAVEKLFCFVLMTSYSYFLFSDVFLTEEQWQYVAQSNLLLSNISFFICVVVLSRVPQIYTNFVNKSTGQLAFLTFFLAFAGVVARLGTVLVETNDFVLILQNVLGTVLNGTLVLQFLLYWKSATKKVGRKDIKKKKL